MSETFNRTLTAVAQRATSADDDIARSLLNQIVTLQATADSLWIPDFRAAYEHEQAEFYVRTVAAADALYQQLHAATAAAARLVGGSANEPLLNVRSLAALDAAVAKAPTHPLAASFRRVRREVALLRWLSTVRNKAVQHRAEEGYVTSTAIVLVSAIVFSRKSDPPEGDEVRKAKALLRGLIRRYGLGLDPGEGNREAIAYLDVVSHALFATTPAEYDSARAIVERAAMHDLVVSQDLLSNADAALAQLIDLIPPNPSSPIFRAP